MVAPVVEELSKQYEGKMRFVKLNTDENPRVPSTFNIRGIPTLIIFDRGELVKRIVGAAPKEYYVKEINAVLNGR
jgi:thioredoxin 1